MSAEPQPAENDALLAESPMFRYECCTHCRTSRCPRHDGHPDPCSADSLVIDGCQAGSTMLGAPTRVISPAKTVEGVGTGADEGATGQDTGTAWVTRSTGCPEAPAQAHPHDMPPTTKEF